MAGKIKGKFKRIALLAAGSVLFAVGAVGLALPVIPTTPFAIASAACFSLSSPKIYAKLASMRFFGDYISNYRNKTGVPLNTKLFSILTLWTLLTVSAVIVNKLYLYIILSAVGTAVTAHISMLKTKKPQKKDSLPNS